jgi:acyl-CoA reductase-like NAD-dependent aldehyde dehydrogenase
MQVINPATEEVVTTLAEDSEATIQKKYQRVKEGQKGWCQIPLQERLEAMQRFQKSLEQHQEALAKVLTQEMGKPLSQSKGEIQGARSRIQFFLDHSEKWLSTETVVNESGLQEKIVFEPLGVIGNISAWNYPYLVGMNVFIPALIAGNVVLYKPSEFSTLTGLKIEELLHASGVPKNAFQTIIGGKNAGEEMLNLPLDGYFFTGSYSTGKYIYEKVAPKMVPCQLELGGKDPLYVTEDIQDLKKVAQAAVEGAFYNNGQSCCAVERVYVHEKVYDRFLDFFVQEVKKLQWGDPMEAEVFLGPLTRKEQINVLNSQVEDAVSKGAQLLTGGKPSRSKGYFFEPTVLSQVNHQMLLMTEESFGPIIGIQKVKDDAEAIRWMQDTSYGLTAAVYSDSRERAEKILSQIDAGTAYWNCCDRVSPHLPWSGRKHSGFGSTLSYLGIRAFVKPKGYHLRG